MHDYVTETTGKEAILDAAQALFAARGFHAVSVQAIAKQAGRSKAAVFHHFPSKLALYRAVVARACEDVRAVLEAIDEAADPLEAFVRFFQVQRQAMQRYSEVARIVLRELLEGNEAVARDLVEQFFEEDFAKLRTLLQKAREQGRIRQDCDVSAAALGASMINSFVFLAWPALSMFQQRPFADADEAANRLFALLMRALGASKEARS